MKNILLAIIFILLTAMNSQPSHAKDVAQALCEYVSVDDKSRFRSFLKSNKLKIRNVFDGVQCNGQNLLTFAGNKNAIKTGSLMLGKLPKRKVAGILATITSAELTAAAQKRISG